MTTETLIWLLPLPPLLAFFLIVLFTNKNKALSHSIAVGAALLSFFGSMYVFIKALGIEHLVKASMFFIPSPTGCRPATLS